MAEIGVSITEPDINREAIEGALAREREEILETVSGALTSVSWPLLRSRIADAIAQALEGDKLPWLAQAWSTAKALQAYKDEGKYPRGTQSFVKLGEHSIEGQLHPTVAVSVNGAEVGALEFTVPITADMNAVSLSVLDGAITGCGGGDCTLSASLHWREFELCEKFGLGSFTLPGKFEFAKPIAIP